MHRGGTIMSALIDAATNALRELKHAHKHHYPHVLCLGRHLCPCANAIAELEAELGMAQMLEQEDPEFQAVDTTSFGAADPSDVYYRAIRCVNACAGIPDPSTAIVKAREALEAVVKIDEQSLAELRVKIPSYKPSQEMLALMEQCREALALLATPKEKT